MPTPHQKVIKDLPLFFQTEFSKEEDKLIEEHGSRWEALFKYIKNESTRIEIEALQPQLVEKTAKTVEIMAEIEKEQIKADTSKDQMAIQQKEAAEQA